MSTDDSRFRTALVDILAGYEIVFPEESERIAAVRERLRSGGNLRDRNTLPGHMTGSAVVLRHEDRSILLIYHRKLQAWMQPGGHVEAGEMPAQAALREAFEETGLDGLRLHQWHATNDYPIDISVHPIPPDVETGEPAHLHYDLRYLVEITEGARVKLRLDEVNASMWVMLSDERIAELPDGLALAARKVLRVIRGDL